jgi:anti-anti-sigma factor
MDIDIQEKDRVIIVRPKEKLFGPEALQFKKALDERLAKVSGIPRFLVDFADVTVMGSSGLGALMGVYSAVEAKNGFMAIINVGPHIENLLIRSRLFDEFEHFDSEAEAIEGLTAG